MMAALYFLLAYVLVMLIPGDRRQRIFMLLLALDHAGLAILTLGGCKSYEMISSALWSLELQGKFFGRIGRPIVDFGAYLLGSKNHCRASYVWQSSLYEALT
jgi:hypothetical protein